VDFYDRGGGAGLGLDVPNQTLSADSLHLSKDEKRALISFIKALGDTAGTRPRSAAPKAYASAPDSY